MNRKRNVSYIKPEDPEFLKVIKRQAGYDERNHKFDDLENAEDDFVDDEESEKPQVVVLSKGDLTAEEAEKEIKKIEKQEAEAKADLSQRVIFKSKAKIAEPESNKRKQKDTNKSQEKSKKDRNLLSFDFDEEDSN